MRIDLSCPVEMWHCKMPTAESPSLAMQIYNLSDMEVNSVQVCVLCFDQEGEQFARHVERVQGIEIPARHAYELTLAVEEAISAQDLEIIIQKAWFVDGTVWRKGSNPALEYTPSPILQSDQLRVMQELAGPDAACFPSDQGAVWVCVCGRANAAKDDECRRCRRDKHELFTKLNEAAVEKIIITRQNILEEQQRLQRQEARRAAQEAEAREKRRRHLRRIITTAAILVLVLGGAAYGVYFHGIPYYRYRQAARALESGQYDSAKEQFLALDDYQDSQRMAMECDYQAAMSALQGGTYTSLRTAWAGFDALADYQDSAAKAQEARYIYAEKLLAAGSYQEAIDLYDQVSSYGDARMKRSQALYDWASRLMNDGDYEAAREKFLSLGAYQNAEANARECLYLPAEAALESDPEKAIALFSQLGDYRDSALKLQSAYYAAGNKYYDQQDYDTAASFFLQAGDYSDAYRRAAGCLYTPALNLFNSGDYLAASEMLEKISGFQDSKEILARCYYNLGLALLEEKAYDGARGYFESAADILPEAEEARKESIYLPALELLENGLETDALTLFSSIPGYKDADAYASRLLYEKSQASLKTEDYAAAIQALEQLNSYEDNREELTAAKVSYAQALTDEGNYEGAIEALSGVEGENAEEAMREARYLLASSLIDQKKYDEAMPILESMQGYADAGTLYALCVYQLAAARAQEGDLAAASQMLEGITGYEDAQQLMQEYAYTAASSAAAEGDLVQAALLFTRAGNYQDAKEQAKQSADTYYSTAYEKAKTAMDRKQYGVAVDTLSALTMDFLPEEYKELSSMYDEARYQYADKLYSDRKPFEALAYYRQIPGYKDVTTKKLTRLVYRMMGAWRSTYSGVEMIFEDDGTCKIDGKSMYYTVGASGAYALSVGDQPTSLAHTYTILSLSENELNLRNIKTNTVYKMKKAD